VLFAHAQVTPKKKGASSKSSPEKTPVATTPRNVAAVSAALAAGVPAGQLVFFISVADPGFLSRIPDPNFFLHPGSRSEFCPKGSRGRKGTGSARLVLSYSKI
jgi:hypothetical protein